MFGTLYKKNYIILIDILINFELNIFMIFELLILKILKKVKVFYLFFC